MENAVMGILIPFVGTSLGAACVYAMKQELDRQVQRGLTGFASGVMIAASIWSLLIPAMEESAPLGKFAFVPAVAGFWLGIFLLLALDRLVPHLHMYSEKAVMVLVTARTEFADAPSTDAVGTSRGVAPLEGDNLRIAVGQGQTGGGMDGEGVSLVDAETLGIVEVEADVLGIGDVENLVASLAVAIEVEQVRAEVEEIAGGLDAGAYLVAIGLVRCS